MKKSWLTGFASVILGVSLAVSSAAAVPFVLGDLTNDGNVTEEDSSVLNRYFAGHYREKFPFDIDKADVDGDGYLTRQDGMRLARYADGWKAEREYFYSEKTGFSVNPQVLGDGVVGYRTGLVGTVYYYYSLEKKYPSIDEFIDDYNLSENYRGKIQAGGIYEELKPSKEITASYPHMIFMFVDEEGKRYTPVWVCIADISFDNLDENGFSVMPYLADENTIKFVAEQEGTIYWSYMKNGAELTPTEFNVKSGAGAGSSTISSGRTLLFAVKKSYSLRYPYIAFMLKNSEGACYTPVILKSTNPSSSDLQENGFSTTPYLADEKTIEYAAEQAGNIYWCYVKDGNELTVTEFKEIYAETKENYCGNAVISSGKTISLALTSSYLDEYPYVAFLLKNTSEEYYSPVCVNAVMTYEAMETGFSFSPYITVHEKGNDEGLKAGYWINLSSIIDGDVYYYFTNDSEVPTAEKFHFHFNDATYTGSTQVNVGGVSAWHTYSSDSVQKFKYVVLQLQIPGKRYAPVIIPNSNVGLNVDSVTDDEVVIVPNIDGTLYYYYSNSSSVNSETFEAHYMKSDDYNNISYAVGEEILIPVNTKVVYYHLILCLKVIDDNGIESYLTPVVIDLEEEGDNNTPTTSKTGLTIDDFNNRERKIKFTSLHDGTVTISLNAGTIKSELTTISVSKDESYEYNYSAIYDMLTNDYLSQLVGSGKAAYINLQLKTDSDTYRTISIPIVD